MAVEGVSLAEKRALIAGATNDVGRTIASAFVEAGAAIALAGLTAGDVELEQLEQLIGELGTAASTAPIAIAADLTAPGGADRLVEAALEALGGLDIAVSCADRKLAVPFADLNDHDWQDLVALNLTAPMSLLRAAGREMLAAGGGRLICVVSILGERGLPNIAAYSACQAAQIQLIRALAIEWARRNVRINGIGLGWFKGDPLLEVSAPLERFLPTRRLGRPDEVGALAVYLASEAADMMTGQTIFIDGGALSHA